jgi:hypothetical protein
MDQMNEATRAYREWYAAEPDQFPLFHSPWWLDAAGRPAAWTVVQSQNTSDRAAVFLPLCYGRKYRLRGIKKPPLTPFLGPLWTGDLSPRKQLRLMEQLVDTLPVVPFFQLTFRPGEHTALPFHWRGYRLRTRYTFQLAYDGEHNPFSDVGRDVKRRLKKSAQRDLRIARSEDIGLLYDQMRAVFRRQESPLAVDRESLLRVGRELLDRKQGLLLVANDEQQGPLASQLIGWDAHSIYLIASGMTDKGRDVDAFYRILGAIEAFLPPGARVIDCCGSMLPGVAKFNAGLGASAVPYQEIRKTPFFNW